jgi:phosphatidylglycerophosphate synthase
VEAAGLAFKAYEIEELADVYFFRPLGMIVARAARALGIGPTAVTVIGAALGVTAGLLFALPRYVVVACLLLILHSVLDSSDGQLARMTGRTSEFGRVLDGASGYVTHIAIYLAVLASALGRGGGARFAALVVAAAAANIAHAQSYDYYRASYTSIAIKGMAVPNTRVRRSRILRLYESLQERLAGLHPQVEAKVRSRSHDGIVRSDDRVGYRRCFYRAVRGWNLLGDNTRFYAVCILALVNRVEWFPLFVLLPMNAAFVLLWVWQVRADRRFLSETRADENRPIRSG